MTWLDPVGIWTVQHSMSAVAHQVIPHYTDSFSLSAGGPKVTVLPALRWNGVDWTAAQILLRVAWVVVALVIAVVAAAFFDRFDPARRRRLALPAKLQALCARASGPGPPRPSRR